MRVDPSYFGQFLKNFQNFVLFKFFRTLLADVHIQRKNYFGNTK